MKLWIISSWVETLALFQFLSHYDHEYFVYCDQEWFPYWEKSFDFVLNRIETACEFLKSKGVGSIIVDPVYELALKYKEGMDWLNILPLFQKYLYDFVFKYSLVGKIWILSEMFSDFLKKKRWIILLRMCKNLLKNLVIRFIIG